MKTIWKATVCIVAVLLSFSIYSCGDDDDETVGSRDLLLGTWNGVYYLSNIRIESSAVIMKKITPMEKLQPDKKASHKEIMDDFVQVESQVLNKMFDFIITNQLSPITHWNEININKPVKGMTEDECLLAFGKPQTIQESNGEVQWMYSSSFYLFFKNGHVETIIK